MPVVIAVTAMQDPTVRDRKPIAPFIAFMLGIVILVGWHVVFPAPVCPVDPDKTIDRMLSADSQGGATVPKGFTVEQEHSEWTTSRSTYEFMLPSERARAWPVGRGYRFTALCRVKDTEAKSWLVSGRNRDLVMKYISEADATRYVPEARTGPWLRSVVSDVGNNPVGGGGLIGMGTGIILLGRFLIRNARLHGYMARDGKWIPPAEGDRIARYVMGARVFVVVGTLFVALGIVVFLQPALLKLLTNLPR